MNLDSTSKKVRAVFLAALGYMIANAVVAAVWRRILLTDIYGGTNFYDVTEPTPLIAIHGLSFYFLTGLVLSTLFMHMKLSSGQASAPRYAFLTGILYWLIHDSLSRLHFGVRSASLEGPVYPLPAHSPRKFVTR